MRGTVDIKNNILSYSNSNEYRYAYFKSKSFKIDLNNLAIIGIYHTLILDDEFDVFVFIDAQSKKHYIPISHDLEGDSFLKIINYFGFNQNLTSLTYDKYEKGTSNILYPKNLQGKKMYINNTFFFTLLKTFKIKKMGDGILSEAANNYLKNIK